LLEWEPDAPTGAPPIFFVAGWVSRVSGWLPLLEVLVRRHRVLYLETREKDTAEIDRRQIRPECFSVERLADDLVEACRQLGLDPQTTVFFGSSMGSNAILEALKGDRLRGLTAFLVGPNTDFHFPLWGRVAVRVVPARVIERLKGFVIWYVGRFRVNASSDPEQMARYVRTIRAADALKLKLSARAVLDYSLLPGLETISTPVAVAFAGSDTLHGGGQLRRIVEAIPNATAIECRSNSYMHSAAVAGEFDAYLASLDSAREHP
jgi:pimeloyl-ACP methyl ester carboxylesterase